jgi:hypothetical protein
MLTHADVWQPLLDDLLVDVHVPGTQLTDFISTKVQELTPDALRAIRTPSAGAEAGVRRMLTYAAVS